MPRFDLHYATSPGTEFVKSREIFAPDLLAAAHTAGFRPDTIGQWSARQAYGNVGTLFCTVTGPIPNRTAGE